MNAGQASDQKALYILKVDNLSVDQCTGASVLLING